MFAIVKESNNQLLMARLKSALLLSGRKIASTE
jgi:hypothetical protein